MTDNTTNIIASIINIENGDTIVNPDHQDEVIVIDSSNIRVGIHTANPEYSLDVSGTIYALNMIIQNDICCNDICSNIIYSISDLCYNDISNEPYRVLNIKQLREAFALRPTAGLDDGQTITSFTGQHRISFNNNINKNNINDYIGLIACSTDNFFNLNNEIDPTINQSLPICELSSKENQKSVYGVISNAEDDNLIAKFHMIAMTVSKTNLNENRISVNSLGEGAIWVCNSNGNLENGDYISSSIIPGYGQKQILHEGILCNFTVAKITGNCDFNLTKNVKKKVKTLIGASGEKLLDYDENNQIQYIDDLDENGNQQLVYKYDTRFIDLQGNILKDTDGNNLELTQQELDLRISNGEQTYVACFVGCTYHCG